MAFAATNLTWQVRRCANKRDFASVINYRVNAMLAGIRQFLTFEETLRLDPEVRSKPRARERYDARQDYFDALEVLRSHLSHCLDQIATLAAMKVPKDSLISHYQGPWPSDAYLPPPSQ